MNGDIDHINDLEKRLYARDPERVPKRKFGILRPLRQKVDSQWGDTDVHDDRPVQRTNVRGYKRFFIFSLLFFLLALGLALFSFFRGAMVLSSKNVDVAILGNAFVAGGEELPIQIEIANKNSSVLVDAHITIDYPKGATDETGADVARITKDLGTIASGKTKSEAFSIVLYGERGITRTVNATLTYSLPGSKSVFQKQSTFAVMINSSPFSLSVDGATAIGANQPLSITVRNIFNGDKPILAALARVEYPNGFVFQSATPEPVAGTSNVWELGDMEKGTERTIVIRGRMLGEQNDEKAFRVYVGARESDTSNKLALTYNSALHTVKITQPFITASIALNSEEGEIVAVPVGGKVSGVVNWSNDTHNTVSDPIFTLSLSGTNFDVNSVTADDAYYDPVNKTITWTSQSHSELATIDPNERGQFEFSFETTDTNRDGKDTLVGLSVSGALANQDYARQMIENADQKIVRFASRLQFASQSVYSIGPIKNTGPFPARADQETSYTINWTIRPTDNALTNARAMAVLPSGVSWAGVIVPQSEALSYNADNRTIIWNIGSVPRATSTPQARTVSFQVKAKPTKNPIGLQSNLPGQTKKTTTNAQANVPLTITRPELSTRLDTDPVYTPGAERVLP